MTKTTFEFKSVADFKERADESLLADGDVVIKIAGWKPIELPAEMIAAIRQMIAHETIAPPLPPPPAHPVENL
ncbi:MAG: hypothetical protein F6J97_08160 [Leptolyngbya sp. SIO4C1]|nr:hypothetical protein [Leptolyngbya sp. SIO4C1]